MRTHFLASTYDELEQRNLRPRSTGQSSSQPLQPHQPLLGELRECRGLKAITVGVSDIEGRLRLLDFDKDALLSAVGPLYCSGSLLDDRGCGPPLPLSLRLDWTSLRWLPSDVFGTGRALVLGWLHHASGEPHAVDVRHLLSSYITQLHERGIEIRVSLSCEGVLLKGPHAERPDACSGPLSPLVAEGYLIALPLNPLRSFMQQLLETQRALGFECQLPILRNAPSQFGVEVSASGPLETVDQLQLIKLSARQLASQYGATACFLPNPSNTLPSNRLSCTLRLSGAAGKQPARSAAAAVCRHAPEASLVFFPSVNAYRALLRRVGGFPRLDPSPHRRDAFVQAEDSLQIATLRLPFLPPDANPYLVLYTLLKAAFDGPHTPSSSPPRGERPRVRSLPHQIRDAVRLFKASTWLGSILGETAKDAYAERKQAVAQRCPGEMGSQIDPDELSFHHEVRSHSEWQRF